MDINNKEENDNQDDEKKEEVKRYNLLLKIERGEFADIKGYTEVDKKFKVRILTNKGKPIESEEINIKQMEEKGLYFLKGNEAIFYLKGPFYEEYIIVEIYCNK